jgi:hypothetical protein
MNHSKKSRATSSKAAVLAIGATLSLATALAACGDDETTNPVLTTVTTTGGGSGGDGGTGGTGPQTACEQYCAVVTENCTGDLAEYDDLADCVAYCDASGWEEGGASDQAGNTISCRTYHATVAADAPEVHCEHAGPWGGAVCGTVDFPIQPSADFVRVDRMGMPAVSTALVSETSKTKNAYNDQDPEDDTAANNGAEFIATLTAIHAALDDDLVAAGLTPCSMVTVVNGLPECIGQEVAPGVLVADLVLPDTLTINPAAPAGFPNGRKLDDPVIDVTLAVVLLKLDSATGCGGGPCTPATLVGLAGGMGLNPVKNDVAGGVFLDEFPYLHPPHTP